MQREKFLNALVEGYRLPEAIISASELSIISTSLNGIITSFNNAAECLLGYKAHEIIGKETPELFHDQREVAFRALELSKELNKPVPAGFETLVAKAKHKNLPDRREWTYIRKDGSRFQVLLSVTALYDEKEQLRGYAVIAIDISEQKKAERRIKDSEAHLQALVSSIDDIILEVDKRGKITHSWIKNDIPAFFSKEDIRGRTLTGIFGQEYSQSLEDALRHVRETGKTFNQELKILHHGEEHWIQVRYTLIVSNGTADRVAVCIEEITKRKQTELSLRASEEKFRLLAENIPGVIYLCLNDSKYSMLYLNDNIEELTGYPATDFLNGTVNFVQLFHSDDKERIIATVNKALKGKTSFTMEYRLHHRSGELRWIQETGIGVYAEDNLLMIEGYINDITSRKKAEDHLNHVVDENYRVFNSSINLTIVVDHEGNFVKVNPAWEKTLGWSFDELKGQNIINFIHHDDIEKTKEEFQRILRGDDNLSTFENRYRRKDGSYRWLLWSSTPQSDRKLIYGSALDITTRKRSEEELLMSKRNLEVAALELEEQNRQLDEFAHIISHNLRSPVGNIRSLINFINENSRIEDYHMIFEKIRKVANNLNETMNELMETLKVKKNTEIEKVEIRFKDILDKVVQSLEGELIECAATVTFDFNEAPKIHYSKTYLESIFQNLLSNAIKYRSNKRPPNMHFSSLMLNDRVVLRVKDNGLGIDMTLHGEKLFGLHKTFHGNKEAKGVGLFLTKTQIEAMGGSISAESEVDKGTTFIIQF